MKTIESVKTIAVEHGQRVRGRRRKTRRFYLLALAIILVALIGPALSAVIGYRMYSAEYQRDLSLAHTGEQHLQALAVVVIGSRERRRLGPHRDAAPVAGGHDRL